jgi:TrpR-related protein YerC/YecD
MNPEASADSAETGLCLALLAMRDVGEMRALLHDLCTPAELEALIDRWTVVPHVLKGTSYREIHAHTAVSVTTIGRVARFLTLGNGGYRKAAARIASRGHARKERRA